MEKKIEIKVRYNETDQMAVVYHGNYFSWFDLGRTNFLREIGLSYSELENKGILLPVIEANCKYKKSAKYDDDIIIVAEMVKLRGVRVQFNYKIIRKADEELLAEGYTVHAFVDKNLKPMNFKKKYPDIWKILKENS